MCHDVEMSMSHSLFNPSWCSVGVITMVASYQVNEV